MDGFPVLINNHVTLESDNGLIINSTIRDFNDEKIFINITVDFRNSGLVTNDEVTCHVINDDYEFLFRAKIAGAELIDGDMQMMLIPITQLEQYVNLRTEKRINVRFVAFTDENNIVSVSNISRSGLLITTKNQYSIGDKLKIKILISYPSSLCNFIGEVVRIKDIGDGKKECGLAITQFRTEDDEKIYKKFVSDIISIID